MSDGYKVFGGRRKRYKLELDDDKLIDLVQKHRVLYDVENHKLGDNALRQKAWKVIGAELKRHPIICKKRWGNIRDNYKKAMKKYNEKSEQGYTKLKKYKFCDKLSFLHSSIENNKEDDGGDTVPIEIKCEIEDFFPEMIYDDCSQEEALNSMNQDQELQGHNSNENVRLVEDEAATKTIENFDNISLAESKASESNEHKKSPSQFPLRRRRRPRIKYEDTESDEVSNVKEKRYYRVESERERHPVDAFLYGIAPTLKSLSPYYLSLAKTQIYSVVQEYEMAMIMEKRNCNNNNQRP